MISACAIRLVFRLTMNASRTTGLERWSSRWPGEVWAKIATIGSARNVIVTTKITANRHAVKARFSGGDPRFIDTPAPARRLLLLRRSRFWAWEEAVRDQPRLAGLAQDLVDERLRVGPVAAPRD